MSSATSGRPPSVPADAAPMPWIIRVWHRMLREPSLMGTVAYVLVSFIGLWANYWYYRAFGLPILEYMQGSDYLIAGLREPAYALCLAMAVLISWLISWPELWRKKHPERVETLRGRWWGRLVFPNGKLFRWWGLTPETGIAFAAFAMMVVALTSYVSSKAHLIRQGAGHAVQVTLLGAPTPLSGEARLLGTNSSFIFLWWPQERRAEAVAVTNVGRLQSLGKRSRVATPASAGSKPAVPSPTLPAIPAAGIGK